MTQPNDTITIHVTVEQENERSFPLLLPQVLLSFLSISYLEFNSSTTQTTHRNATTHSPLLTTTHLHGQIPR